MIKVVIVDDEKPSRDTIASLIGRYYSEAVIVGEAESVKEARAVILKTEPDLVFLDIRLSDGSGFDLLRKLKDIPFLLIFITAYDEFAIKAFKFNAIDYLLKPIDPTEFSETMVKVRVSLDKELQIRNINSLIGQLFPERVLETVKYVNFKTINQEFNINPDEIVKVESQSNTSIIYLFSKAPLKLSKTLSNIEEMLSDPCFLRVHKSYLVNKEYVLYFNQSDQTLVMADQSIIKVSARKLKFVKTLLNIK
jgi:two-component system LytT family response regulator